MEQADAKIRYINPPAIAAPTGYTHVVEVKAGRTIYISGQVALDLNGNLVGKGDLQAQSVQVFENLKTAMASVGAGFENLVKLTSYFVDISQIGIYREVRNHYLKAGHIPASTALQVAGLVNPDWVIEVEAIVFIPD